MGVELALFIIIGAIAILAAVLMLVSENAVHSALFLILNFACVAFFYLMLNAPFLAMVQITVYAGAIMVLFMFVIMLVGAEKLTPDASTDKSWQTPAAVGLTVVFLFVAGLAIMESDIASSEPQPHDPIVRIVHAVGGAPAVNVYIGDELVADELRYREISEFKELESGEYEAVVFAHGDDPAEAEPIYSTTVFLDGDEVASIVIAPDAINGGFTTIEVEGSLGALEDKDTAQLTIVHALPCESGDCAVDIADITVPSDDPYLVVESLNFGEISAVKTFNEGDYSFGVYPAGEVELALKSAGEDGVDIDPIADITDEEFEGNTSQLLVITGEQRGDTLVPLTAFAGVNNSESFGSGESLGQVLFTTYMLPFQAIALLLLVAMVGAIVLTNPTDGTTKKRSFTHKRRMAAVEGTPTVEEYKKMLDQNPSGAGD